MTQASATSQLNVFISYSRRDTAFVDELRISLETYGFNVLYDQEDIAHGEPWEPRLRSLITQADTTVAVVSPAWIDSRECVKELDIALKLGRRVIPVVNEPLDSMRIPEVLARLQYVFFYKDGRRAYARGVANLIEALRGDAAWVREQTRLMLLAAEWEEARKSKALLMRGEALKRAQAWLAGPVPDHLSVLPAVRAYVSASEAGEIADERQKLRGRIWQVALGGVAIAAVLGAGMVFAWAQASAAEINAERADRNAEQAEIDALHIVTATGGDCPASDILSQPSPSAPSTSGPGAPAPGSGSGKETSDKPKDNSQTAPDPARVAALVADLDSPDRTTRLAAGQAVANMIRSDQATEVLDELVGQLQGQNLEALSASGRFNVLYSLNIAESEKLKSSVGTRLPSALSDIKGRAKSGYVIGAQTQDCLNSLDAKLGGQTGVASCGGK